MAAALGAGDVCAALAELAAEGLGSGAVALALEAAAHATAAIDRPELVWSGPEVPGVHARDTRRVFEELVDGAERAVWVSAYTWSSPASVDTG